ncbi:hypothetical protein [Fictibacillus arsenicus]|uniref:Uncharacterized protein n=1 Tax=Fictibacillus arsenicus TaxID=255247 RepID=A0A1V3G7P8_9BACL|nr:hypothetical protein [Fictibacillus arsenicus]OOE12454.1 hypothetical protein UN64_10205 [Fictibacillus arsenicus]
MNTLILAGSIILILVSLSMFLYQFMKAESNKRPIMIVAFFTEPLDMWSSLFYLGLLGFINALVFV